MVVVTTLTPAAEVELMTLCELVWSLVSYVMVFAPLKSTAFPLADVTLTSLTNDTLATLLKPFEVKPVLAPVTTMLTPVTWVMFLIVTVPEIVGRAAKAVAGVLFSVGRVTVPAGGVTLKKLSKLVATVPWPTSQSLLAARSSTSPAVVVPV